MADEHQTSSAAHGGPIQTDPAILSGKPFVRGTRLTVEFLQGLLATGWTREAILEVYPYASPDDIDAALAYRIPDGDRSAAPASAAPASAAFA